MGRPLTTPLVVLLLGAMVAFSGCSGKKTYVSHVTTTAPGPDLTVTPINATLEPPLTTYEVDVFLQYGPWQGYTTWKNTNACGKFESQKVSPTPAPGSRNVTMKTKAVWDHGDGTNCEHTSPHHEGTITLEVTNTFGFSSGGTQWKNFNCSYDKGSTGGRGEACIHSYNYYTEEDDTPAPSAIGVLVAVGLAVGMARLMRGRRDR